MIQILGVKEEIRYTIVDGKLANYDREEQHPERHQQLMSFHRHHQQLDRERVVNIFKPLHIISIFFSKVTKSASFR
jgi:hypothetical protein